MDTTATLRAVQTLPPEDRLDFALSDVGSTLGRGFGNPN